MGQAAAAQGDEKGRVEVSRRHMVSPLLGAKLFPKPGQDIRLGDKIVNDELKLLIRPLKLFPPALDSKGHILLLSAGQHY